VPTSLHNLQTSLLGDDPAGVAALLAGLMESAMDAIITVDQEQKIVLFNRAAESIFGWPRKDMLGQPLERLIPQRFREEHARHLERFGNTGATARRMGAVTVLYGVRADGEEFPIDASISHLDTAHGKLFTVILRDITVRMQSEERHLRLAARLSGLLDSAMDGIITVDESQRIVLYNRAAEKIFGWASDEAIGQPLTKLLPMRYREGHGAFIKRFGTTGVTSRRMGDNTVIHGRRANGEEFPMDASISQLETAEGKLYTVILRDVTERVRAQEERSAFAAAAHAIREEEKTRVARELHDELAQALTALKMDTIWVRDNGGLADEAKAKMAGMLAMLDRAVASTRRIAADLRPLLLDDLGLAPAIEWLASTFTQRWGVACKLNVDEELELPEPYATAVFRIVQESLVNVAKHARAQRAKVCIERVNNGLRLRVEDDGAGFDTRAHRKPNSLGLAGLRERAQLLKGSVVVHSQPGQGTTIDAFIPVVEAES
jgi:PAS domain S-box-containing protein